MIASNRPSGPVSAALARNRLGVTPVVFFVLSGVAPLTVAAGVVTTAYAVTGLTGIPAAFIAVAIVLGLFSVGYVAMARHVTNAGALYAFITHGLGRPVGVAAAFVAVVAYNLLEVGLFGAFGATAVSTWDTPLPWWMWSLVAWLLVAILGLARVDLNGMVLAVLLSAETAILIVLAASGLTHPAGGHISVATLSPTNLTTTGVGAALVIAVLGFVGFEASAVFSEEARNPRRTVPAATYLSLGLIAVVYAGVSWAMAVSTGDDHVVDTARERGPEMLFDLGNPFIADTARALFLTSLFAAMLSFHNAVGRYMFALGRERVLPATLGRTNRSGSPKVASMVQSLIGLTVIIWYAAAGWDPLVQLFFWLGTTGGFGVLLLLTVTSIAVVAFFARDRRGENMWRRIIAPATAGFLLAVMVWLAVDNYSTLLGVAPGSRVAWLLPTCFPTAATIGLVWALVLRGRRSDVYATIGLGANAVTGRATTTVALPPAGVRA